MRIIDLHSPWKSLQSAVRKSIFLVPGVLAIFFLMGVGFYMGQILLIRGYLRHTAAESARAAAHLLRDGRSPAEMAAAAEAVVRAEGVDPVSVRVDTCATDPALCPPEGGAAGRKVRVTVEADYSLTFLPPPYAPVFRLGEAGVSMAAAMDVVLVIDASESMAWDTAP
jgi:hypothetical protein